MREMTEKSSRLKLAMVIVAREMEDTATRLVRKCHIPLHFQCGAEGTASSEVMDTLGLDGARKTLMTCVATEAAVDNLLAEMGRSYQLMQPGYGIAFSMPISGISSPVLKLVDSETREKIKMHMESEVEKVKAEATRELILAVINQGYSDELMEAVKEVGATGGTVVRARRVGMEDTMKLWGISVQEAKELVLIVADSANKVDIMRAIGKKCGATTPAQGFALSLPVDSVVGIGEED